jgi:hypothetical protein
MGLQQQPPKTKERKKDSRWVCPYKEECLRECVDGVIRVQTRGNDGVVATREFYQTCVVAVREQGGFC